MLRRYNRADPIRNRLRGQAVRLVEDDDKFVIGIPEENIGAAQRQPGSLYDFRESLIASGTTKLVADPSEPVYVDEEER